MIVRESDQSLLFVQTKHAVDPSARSADQAGQIALCQADRDVNRAIRAGDAVFLRESQKLAGNSTTDIEHNERLDVSVGQTEPARE